MLTSYEAFQEYMEKAVELNKLFYNNKYYEKAMEALLLDITDAFANTDLTYRDLMSAIYNIEDETIDLGVCSVYSVHITPNILTISFTNDTVDGGKIYKRAYVNHGLMVFIYSQYCYPDDDIDFDSLHPSSRLSIDNYLDDGLLFEIYRHIKRAHPTSNEAAAVRQFYSKGGMKDE